MPKPINPSQDWYLINIRDIKQALSEIAADHDTSIATILQACARVGLANPSRIEAEVKTLKARYTARRQEIARRPRKKG